MVPGPGWLAALLVASALAVPPPATPGRAVVTPSGEPGGSGPGAAPAPAAAPDLSALPPAPSPARAASAPRAVECTVQDVSDDLVSAACPAAGLKTMQFGRVVDAAGFTVARVMIVRLQEKGLVATVVDGRERLKKGTLLRFEASSPEARPPPERR